MHSSFCRGLAVAAAAALLPAAEAGAHGFAKIHDGLAYFTDCGLVQPGGDSSCEGIVPPGANTGKACWLLDGDLDY